MAKTKKEKTLIIVTLLLMVALIVKSFVFDPIDPSKLTEEEQAFLSYIEPKIETYYTGPLYDTHLLQIKTLDVKKTELNDGNYMAKGRKYILGVFPIGDIYLGDDRPPMNE